MAVTVRELERIRREEVEREEVVNLVDGEILEDSLEV